MKKTLAAAGTSSRVLSIGLGSLLTAVALHMAPWLSDSPGGAVVEGVACAVVAVLLVPLERWWQHRRVIMALEEARLRREVEEAGRSR